MQPQLETIENIKKQLDYLIEIVKEQQKDLDNKTVNFSWQFVMAKGEISSSEFISMLQMTKDAISKFPKELPVKSGIAFHVVDSVEATILSDLDKRLTVANELLQSGAVAKRGKLNLQK